MQSSLTTATLVAALIISSLSYISASCNIDSAGIKTYSTSDGLVLTRVGIVATFRLGCSHSSTPPQLHAESDGKYLAITNKSGRQDLKQVSFIEELDKSKSRWVEIKVYDDETYQKILRARESGSSESSYSPLKTISVSHYGVSKGPFIKTETIATFALIGLFVWAHLIKSKIAN